MSGSAAHPFHQWIDLAQPRLGTRVVGVTDEFFGAAERLIGPSAPVFVPDKYDDHGKWMDGWESRRRRTPGHDHCTLRLGVAGIVRGVDIDTSFFTGNYPPQAMLEACHCETDLPGDGIAWITLVPRCELRGDSHHYLPVDCDRSVTHLRLHIFPDGGVARLRVYGEVEPDWTGVDATARVDLLALENGGRALICSDEHFGSMHNLNAPGRGANMGDGWETARRRGPGHDWVVLRLGTAGMIDEVEIDTAHFKGNYPDRASLEGISLTEASLEPEAIAVQPGWQTLLPEVKLEADRQHRFGPAPDAGPYTHVRLNMYPDGGISRLRLFGRLAHGGGR